MNSLPAPPKNIFVSIKALNYFNGIDFDQSLQGLQSGHSYVGLISDTRIQKGE